MGKPAKGDWIATTILPRDFIRSSKATPGTQVEFADGTRALIGDVNPLGGICDDCEHEAFRGHTKIVAYRRIL